MTDISTMTGLQRALAFVAFTPGFRFNKNRNTMKRSHFAALMTVISSLAPAADIPFPNALEEAAVIQAPMTAEIPGSIILGNGDLNGILWVNDGRLRFSITKNDACDGRLVTAEDPELCTIDVKNYKWVVHPGSGFPPSWATPYPTPIICGHVDFSEGNVVQPVSSWVTVRQEGTSSFSHDAGAHRMEATIEGNAGNSAGWGFAPTKREKVKKVALALSGSANGKWYVDLPGTGVSSGWHTFTTRTKSTWKPTPIHSLKRRRSFTGKSSTSANEPRKARRSTGPPTARNTGISA